MEELATELANLPSESKTFLIDKLLVSLGELPDLDSEAAWLEEADDRWSEIQEGKVGSILADEAMRRAFSCLKK